MVRLVVLHGLVGARIPLTRGIALKVALANQRLRISCVRSGCKWRRARRWRPVSERTLPLCAGAPLCWEACAVVWLAAVFAAVPVAAWGVAFLAPAFTVPA